MFQRYRLSLVISAHLFELLRSFFTKPTCVSTALFLDYTHYRVVQKGGTLFNYSTSIYIV